MTKVFCFINTEIRSEEEALEYLNRLEGTKAFVVYGVYDIVAEITKKDMKEFEEFYRSNIGGLNGIRKGIKSSVPCIVL